MHSYLFFWWPWVAAVCGFLCWLFWICGAQVLELRSCVWHVEFSFIAPGIFWVQGLNLCRLYRQSVQIHCTTRKYSGKDYVKTSTVTKRKMMKMDASKMNIRLSNDLLKDNGQTSQSLREQMCSSQSDKDFSRI